MNAKMKNLVLTLCLIVSLQTWAAEGFKVVGFATAQNDVGHISFVNEAKKFFPDLAAEKGFEFEYTTNWGNLNDAFLSSVDIVLFLDTRPENADQRAAFERFARAGGGFLGFHFAAFALTPSSYPQNWNWYHNEFLGSGQYVSNTWKPTSAFLVNEMPEHGAMGKTPKLFATEANEWYRWEKDLRQNPDIDILLAIDDSSFPLGTGPNEWEIWHSGYYPVVWSNNKYNMVYWNMGHNDIDYSNGNADLSHTFQNNNIKQLTVDCLFWMAYRSKQIKFQQYLHGSA